MSEYSGKQSQSGDAPFMGTTPVAALVSASHAKLHFRERISQIKVPEHG